MGELRFETDQNAFQQQFVRPAAVPWLVRIGAVTTKRQAEALLIFIAILALAIAAAVWWKGQPTSDVPANLTREDYTRNAPKSSLIQSNPNGYGAGYNYIPKQ